MNKEELISKLCPKNELDMAFLNRNISNFEKQVREETLKEVLPEEEKENDETDLESSCNIDGFCRCRQGIINKAKDKWGIIL